MNVVFDLNNSDPPIGKNEINRYSKAGTIVSFDNTFLLKLFCVNAMIITLQSFYKINNEYEWCPP